MTRLFLLTIFQAAFFVFDLLLLLFCFPYFEQALRFIQCCACYVGSLFLALLEGYSCVLVHIYIYILKRVNSRRQLARVSERVRPSVHRQRRQGRRVLATQVIGTRLV